MTKFRPERRAAGCPAKGAGASTPLRAEHSEWQDIESDGAAVYLEF
jgi:hypothetical protein